MPGIELAHCPEFGAGSSTSGLWQAPNAASPMQHARWPCCPARRDRGAHAARLDAGDRVAALAGVRLRQLDETRLARRRGFADAASALSLAAAGREEAAHAARLNARDRVAALPRVRLRKLGQSGLAGAEAGFADAARALALAAARRDRGAHAARLHAGQSVPALTRVRLRQLDETGLARRRSPPRRCSTRVALRRRTPSRPCTRCSTGCRAASSRTGPS